MADKGELTRMFETLWRQLGGPALEPEYRFAKGRRWRADFASVEAGVLIEIEGGVWTGGRHTSPIGYTNDCEKYNAAARIGWRVFRFTRPMLETDPAGHLLPVIRLIKDATR